MLKSLFGVDEKSLRLVSALVREKKRLAARKSKSKEAAAQPRWWRSSVSPSTRLRGNTTVKSFVSPEMFLVLSKVPITSVRRVKRGSD